MSYRHINNYKKEKILKRDNYRCHLCHATSNLDIHHILPQCLGGTEKEENLITLCRICHQIVECGSEIEVIEKCVQRAVENEMKRLKKIHVNK